MYYGVKINFFEHSNEVRYELFTKNKSEIVSSL